MNQTDRNMPKMSFFDKLLIWMPGLFFSGGMIFFFIWRAEQAQWAGWAGEASFALFCFMPAYYLAFRRDLAIPLVNIVAHMATSSRNDAMLGRMAQPAINKSDWRRLSWQEQGCVFVIAVIGMGIGLALLIHVLRAMVLSD